MEKLNYKYILNVFKKINDDKYYYYGTAIADKMKDGFQILGGTNADLFNIKLNDMNQIENDFLYYQIKDLGEFVYFARERENIEATYNSLGYNFEEFIRSFEGNYSNLVLYRNKHNEFQFRKLTKVDNLNINEEIKNFIINLIIRKEKKQKQKVKSMI